MRAFERLKIAFGRRKFYYRILFSFAALCIGVICLSTVFSFKLLGDRYEAKILEANTHMLRQVAVYGDQGLYQNVMRIINDHILNDFTRSGFSRFYLNPEAMTQYDYYQCYMGVYDLYVKDPLIRSVTLYRYIDDYLIDSGYGLKSAANTHAAALDRIFPYTNYITMASGSDQSMLLCPPAALEGTARPYLTLFRAVPLYGTLTDGSGFIAVSLDQAAFLNEAAKLYPVDGAFVMLDELGNVLLSAHGEGASHTELIPLALNALESGAANARFSHAGDEYCALGVTGALSGWRYICVSQLSSLVYESTRAKQFIMLASIILLGVGLIIVHGISRRVYRPLKHLRNRATGGNLTHEDDIAVIGKVLGILEDKVDDMENAVRENRDVLIYKAMMDLLHGGSTDEADICQRLALSGTQFTLTYFCVMVTEFQSSVFYKLDLKQREYIVAKAKSFAQNWFDERVLQLSESQPANRVVTLINLRDDQYQALLMRRAELLRAVQPDVYMSVNIAVSPLMSALSEVPAAYAKTCEAFEYSYLYGYGNVFLPDEIKLWETRDWAADWASFQRYEGLLRAGEQRELDALMDEWMRLIKEGGYSHKSAASFIMQLYNSTLKVGGDTEFIDPALKASVLEEFKSARDIDRAMACLKSVIGMYKNAQIERREGNGKRLADEVMAYVRANYLEELSLTMLAERFHVGASHLSRLFKDATGENLSLFIVNYRLEKAAQLLMEYPERSVSDIAQSLGYLTPAYFTRLFKEKYGMTPSQYRKHAAK